MAALVVLAATTGADAEISRRADGSILVDQSTRANGGDRMTTYPNGYGSELLSLDELRSRHADKMHPEYAARLFGCLEAAEGLVGIGGGWRSTATQAANYAKYPGRFAPPGKSFHESHRWASGIEGYAAVDTVGRNQQHEDAWVWMRDNAGQFGLCTFHDVNGEPWHTQFSDLPKGVSSWQAAGSPDPQPLATNSKKWKPAEPDFGLHPLNDGKPVLKMGSLGGLVSYLQLVISHKAGGSIAVDGDFGPQTASRLRDTQAKFGLPVTGVADWNGTWQKIDELAGRTPDAKEESAEAVEEGKKRRKADRQVPMGYYWVRHGDTPASISRLIFGDASQAASFDPPKPQRPGLTKPDHHIRIPGLAGRTTLVRPGEGAWSLIARLYPDANPATLLARFYDLNGGEHRIFQPKDLVFLDDPT